MYQVYRYRYNRVLLLWYENKYAPTYGTTGNVRTVHYVLRVLQFRTEWSTQQHRAGLNEGKKVQVIFLMGPIGDHVLFFYVFFS